MIRKALILVFLYTLAAQAQTTAGRIMGTVFDHTGAAIGGAAVEATNTETGAQLSARTGAEGQYILYPLPPGTYDVVVRMPGFRAESLQGLRIDVAATVTRNVTLTVGPVEQEITVAAEAAPVITQSISVESSIVREQIDALPLNGRDFNQLVLLAAGAFENLGSNRDFGGVAANGNRAFSNDYLLDGTPNNDVYQGRAGAPVSVDVIREFKVTSGVAPAEYGQAGTQVSVVTRSGANKVHGSLFEYHRGNTWEARNPFNTGEQQPFLRNQFGASLGGPVRLPGYNGRNRTFFFFNYEGNRQRETVTRVATVPLDEFWRGDFSSLLSRGIQLRDPFIASRPNIPNNRLDQYLNGARMTPTALKLRPFWGSPNRAGMANNLVQFPKQRNNGDQTTVRIDHQLPRNQSLSARYTGSWVKDFTPSILGNAIGFSSPVSNRNSSLSWTVPLGSHTVNELRAGEARMAFYTEYEDGGLPTVESLGLEGFEPGNVGVPPMARITFSGPDAFTQLNYGGSESYGMAALSKVSNTYTLSEAFTHTRARHTFKAGFELRRLHMPGLQQTNARGAYTFRGANSATSFGYSFADFLAGLPSSTQEVPIKTSINLKQTEFASYVQDDWRATSRLMFSFGLRHELFLNPYEDRNRLAMFDAEHGAIVVASDDGNLPTNLFLPAVVAKLRDANGNWRFPLLSDREAGFNPRRLLETNYRHFGPRFGFVYTHGPRGTTVLRGGYGIFYTRYPIQYLLQTVAVNPPFAGLFTYSQRITNGQAAVTLDQPYGTGSGASASVSPAGLQKDFTLPDNQQWQLTAEREIGWGTVMSLGYVGNKGTHLFRSINANGSMLDDATGQIVRRYTNTFGTSNINFRVTNGNSIYHAMQTEFRRRGKKGVTFQGNWTWAKGIDDVGPNVNSALLDVENLGRDRANSDYVQRHLIKLNALYELPFARRNRIIGGWRLSGIWQYSTGRYFTPLFTTTGGLSNNRPDVVAGVQANLPRGQRSPERWFNPAAFAEVPAVDPSLGVPRFGNAGRNILVGPGLNVVDLSLAKSFALWREDVKMSFRIEAFNAFNHANYGEPDNNISNVNTVATINRILKPMRQVQFALRLDF